MRCCYVKRLNKCTCFLITRCCLNVCNHQTEDKMGELGAKSSRTYSVVSYSGKLLWKITEFSLMRFYVIRSLSLSLSMQEKSTKNFLALLADFPDEWALCRWREKKKAKRGRQRPTKTGIKSLHAMHFPTLTLPRARSLPWDSPWLLIWPMARNGNSTTKNNEPVLDRDSSRSEARTNFLRRTTE